MQADSSLSGKEHFMNYPFARPKRSRRHKMLQGESEKNGQSHQSPKPFSSTHRIAKDMEYAYMSKKYNNSPFVMIFHPHTRRNLLVRSSDGTIGTGNLLSNNETLFRISTRKRIRGASVLENVQTCRTICMDPNGNLYTRKDGGTIDPSCLFRIVFSGSKQPTVADLRILASIHYQNATHNLNVGLFSNDKDQPENELQSTTRGMGHTSENSSKRLRGQWVPRGEEGISHKFAIFSVEFEEIRKIFSPSALRNVYLAETWKMNHCPHVTVLKKKPSARSTRRDVQFPQVDKRVQMIFLHRYQACRGHKTLKQRYGCRERVKQRCSKYMMNQHVSQIGLTSTKNRVKLVRTWCDLHKLSSNNTSSKVTNHGVFVSGKKVGKNLLETKKTKKCVFRGSRTDMRLCLRNQRKMCVAKLERKRPTWTKKKATLQCKKRQKVTRCVEILLRNLGRQMSNKREAKKKARVICKQRYYTKKDTRKTKQPTRS